MKRFIVKDYLVGRDKARNLGGIATGRKERAEAISKYYENPNKCKFCGKIIEVEDKKVAEIRKKKYCNSSCAAKFNNTKRERKRKYITKKCVSCGNTFDLSSIQGSSNRK